MAKKLSRLKKMRNLHLTMTQQDLHEQNREHSKDKNRERSRGKSRKKLSNKKKQWAKSSLRTRKKIEPIDRKIALTKAKTMRERVKNSRQHNLDRWSAVTR
jgi:hypothetical protein